MKSVSCSCRCSLAPKLGQAFPSGFTNTFVKPIGHSTMFYLCSPNDIDNHWTDGTNFYYSKDTSQFVHDGAGGWSQNIWKGLTSFSGKNIWTDGMNIYYSYVHAQYVLNGDTWEPKTWNVDEAWINSFNVENIWTDGTDIYFSYGNHQYVLNKETDTWEPKIWYTTTSILEVDARMVWSDGKNIYHSDGAYQHKLVNGFWELMPNSSGINGQCVWTDGTNTYYSEGSIQGVLVDGIPKPKEWGGLRVFYASDIYTNGKNIYCYNGSEYHILLPSTAKLYQRASGQWIGPCTMR